MYQLHIVYCKSRVSSLLATDGRGRRPELQGGQRLQLQDGLNCKTGVRAMAKIATVRSTRTKRRATAKIASQKYKNYEMGQNGKTDQNTAVCVF